MENPFVLQSPGRFRTAKQRCRRRRRVPRLDSREDRNRPLQRPVGSGGCQLVLEVGGKQTAARWRWIRGLGVSVVLGVLAWACLLPWLGDVPLPRVASALVEPGYSVSLELGDQVLESELESLLVAGLRHGAVWSARTGTPSDAELKAAAAVILRTRPWRVDLWCSRTHARPGTASVEREFVCVVSGGGFGEALGRILPNLGSRSLTVRGQTVHLRVVDTSLIVASSTQRAAELARKMNALPKDTLADGSPIRVTCRFPGVLDENDAEPSSSPVDRSPDLHQGAAEVSGREGVGTEEANEGIAVGSLMDRGEDRWTLIYRVERGGRRVNQWLEEWSAVLAQDGVTFERHEILRSGDMTRGELVLEGLAGALRRVAREMDYWSEGGSSR